MTTPHEEHHPTNFGVDVATAVLERHEQHATHVAPAHVDEHAREELLVGHDHSQHGTNFGLVLPEEEG